MISPITTILLLCTYLYMAGCDTTMKQLTYAPEEAPFATVVDDIEWVPDPAVSPLSSELNYSLNEIEVMFNRTATKGNVDTLLSEFDARIVSALKGVPIVIIRMTNRLDVKGLDEAIVAIEAKSYVVHVRKSYFPRGRELPDVFSQSPYTPNDLDKIAHLLAARFPAAWNVRSLIVSNSKPIILIGDHFGDGPPQGGFDITPTVSDYRVGNKDRHGYRVLSIIAANFSSVANLDVSRNKATGAYPTITQVKVIDLQMRDMGLAALENNLILEIKSLLEAGKSVIVNTSVGWKCETLETMNEVCNTENVINKARSWIMKVRGSDLEGKYLHVAAAGNIHPDVPDATDAKLDSIWGAATLHTQAELTPSDSESEAPEPVPPLSNTLIIEGVSFTDAPDYRLGCLYESKRGGHLSAVGKDVWSIYGNGNYQANATYGTSYATPQVTALAAYLWSIYPDLTVTNLKQILLDSSDLLDSSQCDNQISAAPMIDAYEAVLTLDTLMPGSPVRERLLDVADSAGNPGTDNEFNEKDIELFIDNFAQPSISTPNYSRFDLNGDGFSGTGTATFDLDINNSIEIVDRTINEEVVLFDEEALTDQEVLCYYAYTELFNGDASQIAEVGLACVDPNDGDGNGGGTVAPEPLSGGEFQGSYALEAMGGCWSRGHRFGQYDQALETYTGGGDIRIILYRNNQWQMDIHWDRESDGQLDYDPDLSPWDPRLTTRGGGRLELEEPNTLTGFVDTCRFPFGTNIYPCDLFEPPLADVELVYDGDSVTGKFFCSDKPYNLGEPFLTFEAQIQTDP